MQILQLILGLVTLLLTLYIALKLRTPRLAKVATQAPLLMDSSALIDGRILEIAKTGFLPSTLVVPSSVLREMQYLADKGDTDKRARARHGLDIVSALQDLESMNVSIHNDGLPSEGGVDERLVMIAKQYKAKLVTLDFNLNKVAQAEGVSVLNINQLAQQLRMNYLPGEKRDITIVQKGQDKTQGVGYLEDGTMVVVENAAKYVGKSLNIEFTRAIQTQSGKMLFAKLASQQSAPVQKTKKPPVKNNSNHKQLPLRKTKRTPEDSLVELANK
jgi:uncharacterized protein YacL